MGQGRPRNVAARAPSEDGSKQKSSLISRIFGIPHRRNTSQQFEKEDERDENKLRLEEEEVQRWTDRITRKTSTPHFSETVVTERRTSPEIPHFMSNSLQDLTMIGLAAEEDINGDFTSQISDKLQYPVTTGSFGEVYRCIVESSKGKKEVAVKVLKIDPTRTTEKLEKAMYRELEIWLKLKHWAIVPLLGTARVDSSSLALVSQWMSSGTLAEYLDEQATIITPSARIGLAKGIAEGLIYLHSENVIHGDLHPANVLIDDSGNPCLTDFGLATVAENPDLQWTTTTLSRDLDSRWRAPEVLGIDGDPERPTFKSDIYSFGSVMFFIISGDIPWKKKRSNQIIVQLSRGTTPARPHNIFGTQWDLIQQCWTWKPEHRPAATIVGEQAEDLIRQQEAVYLAEEENVRKSSHYSPLSSSESLSIVSPDRGASAYSVGDSGPFSGADAAIMADAFRKALRGPGFARPPVEEAGDHRA